jgi:hypothetical protein
MAERGRRTVDEGVSRRIRRREDRRPGIFLRQDESAAYIRLPEDEERPAMSRGVAAA